MPVASGKLVVDLGMFVSSRRVHVEGRHRPLALSSPAEPAQSPLAQGRHRDVRTPGQRPSPRLAKRRSYVAEDRRFRFLSKAAADGTPISPCIDYYLCTEIVDTAGSIVLMARWPSRRV